MVSSGHLNSLERTLEVVDIVVDDKDKLVHLLDCYSGGDTTVSLNVSNAFKRKFS